MLHDRFQNPADCICDGFIRQRLLRRVDQRQVQVDRPAVVQNLLLQAVGLLRAPPHEVAFVGPFVELFGDGKEHLDRLLGVRLREPHVAEREDEAAFAALEQTAHGPERTEPFGAG